MNENSPDDLEVRIIQLLDGELEGNEIERLDADLQNDRQARALYLRMAALHSALEDHFISRSEIAQVPLIPVERLLARQRQRMVRHSMTAAAALLVVSAVALWMKMAPAPSDNLGRFHVAHDSSFTLTHNNKEDAPFGNSLRAGSRLELSRGVLEIKFSSGARSVVEAPCAMVVLAENRISMEEGVAWFEVPPAAAGFTIDTPLLRIVDLGTEFGVLAPANGAHEVHVIKGSVEVSSAGLDNRQSKVALKAGQARRMDANGKLFNTAFDAARFITVLHKPIVIRNPDFDSQKVTTQDPAGYGPIADWATSGEDIGTSDRLKPFLNQPAHSGSHVAFIQNRGAISQTVSGFDPSKHYTVTYFVSERGLPGAATRTSVSLDLGSSAYSPAGNIVKTDAFRRIVSGPLAVFGPTANIEITADAFSGDAALLVDTVSISRAVPAVPDGGFENPVQSKGRFKQAVGIGTGELSGSAWSFAGGGGITTNGSAFAPPMAPEGSQAAILQDSDAGFRTMVSGFEPGVTYSLSLEAAGRRGGAADFRVMLDGGILMFGGSENLSPAIGSYQTFTSDGFTASGESATLRFETSDDGTTFIDDIRFNFVAEAKD
jgi:adhesin HecA-like repeat protein